MARIVFQPVAVEATEVEIFGLLFELLPFTKSVEDKLEKMGATLDEIAKQDDASEKLVDAVCDGFDFRLKPSGHTAKASTVLKREYRANKIDSRRLLTFREQLDAADRPT